MAPHTIVEEEEEVPEKGDKQVVEEEVLEKGDKQDVEEDRQWLEEEVVPENGDRQSVEVIQAAPVCHYPKGMI